MSWRKKNDWEGYKSFLLESEIWEEFNQRYDYTTRRYVGSNTAKERIKGMIVKLENGTERQFNGEGELVVYQEKDGSGPIVNANGNHIPLLGIPTDDVKVYRMNTFMKSNVNQITKKYRKHMFKYIYERRLRKFLEE
tara:strand:- start:1096 stop:1506 length:411 start_codon:yes stop_codon:yes gene_type:complete